MPERDFWESLFNVPLILDRLGLSRFVDVAECGCGYGTFTVPVAERIGGTLYAFDIEPEMVDTTLARSQGLPVVGRVRDVVAEGFGVSVDAVLLFNIVHCEDPVGLLKQAAAALRPGGRVLAIHWRSDLTTPRGPSLAIRPTPLSVTGWATRAGLKAGEPVDLPPWHWGIELSNLSR